MKGSWIYFILCV